MQKNTKVGRWYLAITPSNWDKEKTSVTICDTDYTSEYWVKDYNPQGYQIVATYYTSTFVEHDYHKLVMQGDCPSWTIEGQDLVDAQNWVKENK